MPPSSLLAPPPPASTSVAVVVLSAGDDESVSPLVARLRGALAGHAVCWPTKLDDDLARAADLVVLAGSEDDVTPAVAALSGQQLVLAVLVSGPDQAAAALRQHGVHDVVRADAVDLEARLSVLVACAQPLKRWRLRSELTTAVSFDASYDFDLETGALVWNIPLRRHFGYSAVDNDYRWWLERVHEAERVRIDDSLQRALESGQREWTESYRFRRHDGTWAQVVDRAIVLRDEAGRAVRMVGAMADVSAETELRTRAHFTDRLRSLGLVAAGVGHEIGQPLAALIGNLELLLTTSADEQQPPLHDALLAAQQIKDIASSLRTFARPAHADRRAVDVVSVLNAALTILRHELRRRARLHTALAPLPPVLAESAKLMQVFVNLIANAAQAGTDGVRHDVFVSTSVDAQGRAVVEVKDSGRGIDALAQQHIFEPFYTTRVADGGTGLGLAIAKSLIEEAHGTIELESSLGHGSTFRVRLPPSPPLATSPDAASGPDARAAAAPGRARILIVDDDPLVRQLLVRWLERDHDVAAVDSAEAALRHMETSGRQHLVLVDLSLPGLDGATLIRELRARYAHRMGRVVAMSAGIVEPAERRASEGASAAPGLDGLDAADRRELLKKPFDLEAVSMLARTAAAW